MKRAARLEALSRQHWPKYEALVLVAAFAAMVPAPANACRQATPGLYSASEEVPIDGVVALRWRCAQTPCTLDEIASNIVVETNDSETRSEVPGDIVRRGAVDDVGPWGWALWRPREPLVAGHEYVIGEAQRAAAKRPFRAVASLAFDPTSLVPQERAYVAAQQTGNQVCCERAEDRRSSCGLDACFSPKRQERVHLEVEVPELPPGADQWLYRWTYLADDQVQGAAGLQLPTSAHHVFEVAADRYCYALEAEHTTDGELVPVAEGCVELGVEQLETSSIPADELVNALRQCKSAPPGYEAEFRALAVASDVSASNTEAAEEPRSSGCAIGGGRASLDALLGTSLLLGLIGLGTRRK